MKVKLLEPSIVFYILTPKDYTDPNLDKLTVISWLIYSSEWLSLYDVARTS